MAAAVAAEASHRRHHEPERDSPEGDAVRTAGQAGARRRLPANPGALGRRGVAAGHGLALGTPGHQNGAAPVALLVVRVAETIVPTGVRERLGPVGDLD